MNQEDTLVNSKIDLVIASLKSLNRHIASISDASKVLDERLSDDFVSNLKALYSSNQSDYNKYILDYIFSLNCVFVAIGILEDKTKQALMQLNDVLQFNK